MQISEGVCNTIGCESKLTKIQHNTIKIYIFVIKGSLWTYNAYIYCRQSLWRWRRMHTRASVEDLKKALQSVRRKDVIEAIDEELTKIANKPNIPSPAFRTVRFPKLQVHS